MSQLFCRMIGLFACSRNHSEPILWTTELTMYAVGEQWHSCSAKSPYISEGGRLTLKKLKEDHREGIHIHFCVVCSICKVSKYMF